MKSIQGNQICSAGGTGIAFITLLRQRRAEGQFRD